MLIKAVHHRRPEVRLRKLSQTDNTWIFMFSDARHRLTQTIIVPKVAPWESVAEVWDDLHARFRERIREKEWTGQ